MKEELNIRLVYGVTQRTFNVGDKGKQKTFRDPLSGRTYGYGSSSNVKHNLKETYIEEMNVEPTKRTFVKTINKDKIEQDVVLYNCNGLKGIQSPEIIFGMWNSIAVDDSKYKKLALKSCVRVAPFVPLNTVLSCYQDSSSANVNVGYNGIDNIAVKCGKDDNLRFYLSAEDLMDTEKVKQSVAEIAFNSPLWNIYDDKGKMSGIYTQDYTIELDRFGMIEKTTDVTEEETQKLLDEGWTMRIVRNHEYIVAPRELRVKWFECLVNAIFSFNFSSNNSLDAKENELLRISFAVNKTSKWDQCTFADIEGHMIFKDDCEDVYCYNTTLLSKYYNCTDNNIKTDFYADDIAKEKMIEICTPKLL